MIASILYLLGLGFIVFVLNLFPAFMPPTWMVLAFFYVRDDLTLVPTVLVGAGCAALGRFTLAWATNRYFKPLLSPQKQKSLYQVGKLINQKRSITLPLLMLFYAFSPIPSNQFFIAAGLVGADLPFIAFSFFLGRLLSYSFWVTVADHAVSNLDDIFIRHLRNPETYFMEIISFIVLYIVIHFLINRALNTQSKKA
ncbi:hypothetical protein M1116_03600 [Patescibacteria group bacterium]|nr:hypothetical protein [Patescibacteria group bacterium]